MHHPVMPATQGDQVAVLMAKLHVVTQRYNVMNLQFFGRIDIFGIMPAGQTDTAQVLITFFDCPSRALPAPRVAKLGLLGLESWSSIAWTLCT